VKIASAYGHDGSFTRALQHGRAFEKHWNLKASFGWYGLAVTVDGDHDFLCRVAGHIENGRDSISDPALSGHA
jgi:phospholipase C